MIRVKQHGTRMFSGMLLAFLTAGTAFAQQSTDYLIVEMPIGVRPANSVMWVKWTGTSRNPLNITFPAPDSGTIYYDRSPGGGKLGNYRYKVTVPYVDTVTKEVRDNVFYHESPPKRGTAFMPIDQADMRSGVFYCVVAWPLAKDTLISNEFQIYVESPDPVNWTAPKGTITDLTPTFTWDANPGVPYYHVVLSDEAISVDTTSGKVDLAGLSIIWQAITPNTQIVYGAPDPSKTITAEPPPLSPGQTYTWVVLNNYGNHPAFSSTKVKIFPMGEFTIAGTPLRAPKNVYPADGIQLTSINNKTIQFKWTNLDPAANSYKVYVYVGSDFEGINAKMAIWQNEISADSTKKITDTMSLSIDAVSVLTNNDYVWKVIAIDNKGAGSAGDTSRFHYSSPTSTMSLHTRENIIVAQDGKLDTIVTEVGLVKIDVQVLDGSMEAPLLFYTDTKGNLVRTRPTGTYRVTCVKDGFLPVTRTISVATDDTVEETFYLERPEATVFGRVLDKAGKGINLAKVKGISDRGDSVSTFADALGNFILNCYAADWNIHAEMTGYKSSLARKITVTAGESYNFGTITLEQNPFTLSGIVSNTTGSPLLGVKVQLLNEGSVLDEVPSTPQTGAFSFTVPAGTYKIRAVKAGFTTYEGPVDVLSSKSVKITMAPGARMVNGIIAGTSWVGDKKVYAPIPNARIKFTTVGSSADTFTAITDATYGHFTISVPGGKAYIVTSYATGYIDAKGADTLTSIPDAYNDTLRALASISGTVRIRSDNSAAGSATVNLIDLTKGTITVGGSTSRDGTFELLAIPDGYYRISAGKEGFVLDSVAGRDSIMVNDGRADVNNVAMFLKPGDKTIKWVFAGVKSFSGSIKMQSPIVKTFAAGDSLARTGAGDYIVTIDASSDSLIDLSYHKFTISDSETVHIDTVPMSVVHHKTDTLVPSIGKISLELSARTVLDSAVLFYKDVSTASYRSVKDTADDSVYTFEIEPPKDGSFIQYYYKAYSGGNIYGYDKEPYTVYVRPDTTRLTKFEIVPSGTDTLLFPASYTVTFSFRGYYSSSFVRDTSINGQYITWELLNKQGCTIGSVHGVTATVTTAGSVIDSIPVVLRMSLDTTKIHTTVKAGNADTVRFFVTGKKLSVVTISRIDGKNPAPISTSPTDRAEFIASGLDSDSNSLSLSPVWSVQPASAGTISSDGSFKPSSKFVGFVRVFASAGGILGEYNPRDIDHGRVEAGLNVRFLITGKAAPDTASNGRGCALVFPPHVVQGSDLGLLDLTIPDTRNQIRHGMQGFRMIDSVAYDIKQLENIALNTSEDSIRLVLTIPESYQANAASGRQKIFVGQWDLDSLKWDTLGNSVVSQDGKTVCAKLSHFSRYAILAEPGNLSGYLTISPNPFSPYVKPIKEYGVAAPFGTCIKFKADMPEQRLNSAKVRIYNVVGDLVWSLEIYNAKPDEYRIWWDGKTNPRDRMWEGSGQEIRIQGKEMCRNGRYFVVVTLKDIKGKQRQVMKPLVLMK